MAMKKKHIYTNGNLKKEFTVAGDVARDLNRKDVTIEEDNTWLYLLIGFALIDHCISDCLVSPKEKRMKQSNWFWKVMIDGLILCGFIFSLSLFSKENLIGIQLGQKQLIVSDQLPDEFMEEEQIQIPTMEDVLTPQPAELTAYGFVSIEALQFQQPLFGRTDESTAAARRCCDVSKRTLTQDNFVILGHHLGRQSLLFGLLKQAETGMEVSVTYLDQTQTYTIDEVKQVNETDLTVIENQQPLLTLITCPTPSRTDERLVISAKADLHAFKNAEQSEKTVEKSQQWKSRQYQKQIWQRQVRKSWFFLLLFLLIMCGCLWYAHRLMARGDRSK